MDPSSALSLTDLPPGWWVALALFFVLVTGWLHRRWVRHRRLSVHHERGRKARKAEFDARTLLTDHGFTILQTQEHRVWEVFVDAEPVEITLFADYVVERDGLTFVAEVKSGTAAPDIRNAATRRQLLEYFCAFDVDGVILVDMEAVQLHEIDFHIR